MPECLDGYLTFEMLEAKSIAGRSVSRVRHLLSCLSKAKRGGNNNRNDDDGYSTYLLLSQA